MKQPENDSEVFAEPPKAFSPVAPGEIVIGSITGIGAEGQPLVDYPENPAGQPLAAMTTVGITAAHLGRNVALLFAKGDPQQPVIMGLIHSPLHDLIIAYDSAAQDNSAEAQTPPSPLQVEDVTIDGKRVVIEGKDEIVFKCGEASITLTKAGKILIHGNYLLNRSSGVNRIMGGSVQVN